MAFMAKYPGTCAGCGKAFAMGTLLTGKANTLRHVVCPGGRTGPMPFPPDKPDDVPSETYTIPTVPVPEPSESESEPQQFPWEPKPGNKAEGQGEGEGGKPPMTDDSFLGQIAEAVRTRIQPGIEEHVDQKLDESLDLLAGEVAKRIGANTRTVNLVRADGVTVKAEGEHWLFPRVAKLLSAGVHVYLWGPAGSGKTTMGLHVADALGRYAEIDTLDPTTMRSMIQGYRDVQGAEVHTAWTRVWGKGGVYVCDELDMAPAHTQNLFNAALANRRAVMPWGMVDQHAEFGFIGTGNTPGFATTAYPDRKPMSAAFRDRLYFVHVPIDPAIEARAAGLPEPAAPARAERTMSPADWVTWVQLVREYCAANVPTLMVTPRASLVGMTALGLGETPDEVADALVFRGADQGIRDKVLAAVPLGTPRKRGK